MKILFILTTFFSVWLLLRLTVRYLMLHGKKWEEKCADFLILPLGIGFFGLMAIYYILRSLLFILAPIALLYFVFRLLHFS